MCLVLGVAFGGEIWESQNLAKRDQLAALFVVPLCVIKVYLYRTTDPKNQELVWHFCTPPCSSTHKAHTQMEYLFIHTWGYAVHHLGCTVQPRWRVRKNEGKRLNLPVWGSGILRKPECCTGIFTLIRLHTGPSMAERQKVTVTFDHNLTHVMFSGYFWYPYCRNYLPNSPKVTICKKSVVFKP